MSHVPTILLVDDSVIVLEWVKIVLEQAGMRVLTHAKPMGVGAIIVRERPDLVLIDLNMPTLEGDEVVRVARKTDAVASTLLILHSSRPSAELEQVAQRCGADGFLEKTLDETTLVRGVRRFLDRARMRPPVSKPSTVSPIPSPSTQPRLPVPVVAAPPKASPLRALRPGVMPRPLFVDDDMRILEGYRRAFELHMRGHYANSGAEALVQIDSSDPPDIVVCDLIMPEMSGIDLYDAMVQRNPDWRYRFVFVTGNALAEPLIEGLGQNTTPVLKKPVDPATLSGLIRVLRST